MGRPIDKKEIVSTLKEELQQKLVEVDALRRVIELLELLDDSKHHERPIREGRTKKPRITATKKKTKKVPDNKISPGSEYKGVQRFVNKTTRAVTFNAQYWDSANKKTVGLGRFDNELKAAAAVQRALGNEKEADRLLTNHERFKKAVETYFRCRHCNLETKTKPVQCMQCNSASFSGPLEKEV